jgi:cell cycle checkpoint protein
VLELARPSHPDAVPAPSSLTARELISDVVESAEGDLRNAVNTLQVVCTKSEKRGVKRKANGKVNKEGRVSKRDIAAASGKETTLVLFHALGKILYNKRAGDPNDEGDSSEDDEYMQEAAPDLVETLPLHWRPLVKRKSRVDCEVSVNLDDYSCFYRLL